MNWKLSSKLNIVKTGAKLNKNVTKQFNEGDEVWIRYFSICNKWLLRVILYPRGPISYKVLTEKGIVKKHIDHLHKKETP